MPLKLNPSACTCNTKVMVLTNMWTDLEISIRLLLWNRKKRLKVIHVIISLLIDECKNTKKANGMGRQKNEGMQSWCLSNGKQLNKQIQLKNRKF
ncbi:unnamed protein product (macronuclear) [Paramecium tetraurelia]|uniref:Uncharacterized protein n=1 Tax=Paramecium tetraurelia TaxID=5888 RepID=A0CYR4_PARTE|nr:uncharacterized protein GSPATT00011532001 [Paramecium tetraurelia]CAK75931.1 unnamed protein product [Paramecium tetraurelia]|eukprot:XP_001443328.1 hypothetical protein (macronuclear) [Paramecium tetraurelia strain d4-2]